MGDASLEGLELREMSHDQLRALIHESLAQSAINVSCDSLNAHIEISVTPDGDDGGMRIVLRPKTLIGGRILHDARDNINMQRIMQL